MKQKVRRSASNVALMKFPLVRVWPHELENTSCTPAKAMIFFRVSEPTTPVPRGAGMSRTETEPHLPVTWWRERDIVEENRGGEEDVLDVAEENGLDEDAVMLLF